MTAGFFDEINSKANSFFGEFTSFAGSILGHGHHTATSAVSNEQPTATLSTSSTYSSTGYRHHSMSAITTSISSVSSPLSKITTTFTSDSASTPASTPASIPTALPTGNAKTSHTNAYQLYFISLLFAAALIFMLILFCSAPIMIRSFKFAINFLKIVFDKSGGTFSRDSEAGLTSNAFTLQDNIDREDRRHGLNKKAKLRILWFMFWYEEPFDEARLRYVKYQFALNGIGEDGQPLDPKYMRTEY